MRIFTCMMMFSAFMIGSVYGDSFPIIDPNPIHEAFATKFTDVGPIETIAKRPPAPKAETKPTKPFQDAVWISGYWAWIQDKNDFEWVCGVWRRVPPNHVWISGYWYEKNGGFSWMRGFWSPVSQNQLTYIQKPPPNPVQENVSDAPNENYFWANGYWDYNASTKQYSWLGGQWQPFDRNWVLAPSHYVWRPEGYVFIPFYWDWAIDNRGNAYSCTERGIVIETDIIIRRLFLHYPDHISWYWHWWHYHPHFWGDCMCLPPWWHWHGWWAFNWHDHWNMWWWWGHPGFPHPFWLAVHMSNHMGPPFPLFLNFLNNWPMPLFITPHGIPLLGDWLDAMGQNLLLPNDPNALEQLRENVGGKLAKPSPILRPTGPTTPPRDLPRPVFPETVREAGKVSIPRLPTIRITLPPKPEQPAPPVQQEPPRWEWQPPRDTTPQPLPRPRPRPRPRPPQEPPRWEWQPPRDTTPQPRPRPEPYQPPGGDTYVPQTTPSKTSPPPQNRGFQITPQFKPQLRPQEFKPRETPSPNRTLY